MDDKITKKNIFVSTTFISNGNKISKPINLLKKNKILNIELGSNHIYEKKLNYILKHKKLNYIVHNYFPVPKNSFVVNIASLDKKIRNMSLKHIKKSIKFCKKINAKLYTFHPGFLSDPNGVNLIQTKNYDFNWIRINTRKNYNLAWKNMVTSIKKIIKFSKKNNINIAIESEGSYYASDHLLMQKPIEYKKFMKIFKSKDIGINLNIGHLNLASKKFNFDKIKFINEISSFIVAFECSHNFGKNDDHLPLRKNSWYWKILNNKQYDNCYKVLEFRNTKLKEILTNINYFK